MKRIITICSALILACIGLTGCGTNQSNDTTTKAENSSLKAENSSLKAKKNSEKQAKYSNQEYALMAYLKLQGQTANELKQNKDNMNWKQDNNKFTIDFGAHATVMTVTDKQVQLTYDKATEEGMGQGNGHKVYTKQELAEKFGNQKSTLDEILDTVNENSNNSSNTQSSAQNNQSQNNQSQNNTANQANNTTDNTTSNSDQEKPLVKDGNTYRPKYNADGQIDYWQVTGSDGITRTMGDPSSGWQEIENEYNNLNNN